MGLVAAAAVAVGAARVSPTSDPSRRPRPDNLRQSELGELSLGTPGRTRARDEPRGRPRHGFRATGLGHGASGEKRAMSATGGPLGHGVNQRDIIKMTTAEVDAFLAERRPMSMCTINHDGTIHAVAMWYGFLDGSVAVESKAKSQKIQNLRRDPLLTCLFEDGDAYEDLRGVELVGRAELIEDPAAMFPLGVSVFERYYGAYREDLRPFVETMLNKRVVAKLNVDRVVTWDHRKLGLPPTRPAS